MRSYTFVGDRDESHDLVSYKRDTLRRPPTLLLEDLVPRVRVGTDLGTLLSPVRLVVEEEVPLVWYPTSLEIST